MGLLDTFSFFDDVRRMDKRQVGISSAFLPNVEVQVMRSNNASSHISPDGFLASITLLSLVIDINIMIHQITVLPYSYKGIRHLYLVVRNKIRAKSR